MDIIADGRIYVDGFHHGRQDLKFIALDFIREGFKIYGDGLHYGRKDLKVNGYGFH